MAQTVDNRKIIEIKGQLGEILSKWEQEGAKLKTDESHEYFKIIYEQLSNKAKEKINNQEILGNIPTIFNDEKYPCVFWVAKFNQSIVEIGQNHEYYCILKYVDPNSTFAGSIWNDIGNRITYINSEFKLFLSILGVTDLPIQQPKAVANELTLKSHKIEVLPWSATKLIIGCLGIVGASKLSRLISDLNITSSGKINEQVILRSLQLGILGYKLWDQQEENWLDFWGDFSICLWDNAISGVLTRWYVTRNAETTEQPTFVWDEEANFSVFLSVHGHAKSYSETSAAESYLKRYKAFCSQLGNSSGVNEFQGSFTKTIWKPESLSKLQGILSVKAKGLLYRQIVSMKTDTKYSWLSYVYLLMEGNGMTMIRETNSMLTGTPLKGFFDKRMVVEVRDFINGYNKVSNKPAFLYSWYTNPDILDEFAQAKFVNLYSLTLTWCNEHGKMKNYNSSLLDRNVSKSLLNAADVTVVDSTDESTKISQEVLKLLHCKANVSATNPDEMRNIFAAMVEEYRNK